MKQISDSDLRSVISYLADACASNAHAASRLEDFDAVAAGGSSDIRRKMIHGLRRRAYNISQLRCRLLRKQQSKNKKKI